MAGVLQPRLSITPYRASGPPPRRFLCLKRRMIIMKRKLAYVLLAASFSLAPLAFTTGCAVTQGRESAKSYAKDKSLAARIKTALYTDSKVKGTQVEVQSLNGE